MNRTAVLVSARWAPTRPVGEAVARGQVRLRKVPLDRDTAGAAT